MAIGDGKNADWLVNEQLCFHTPANFGNQLAFSSYSHDEVNICGGTFVLSEISLLNYVKIFM